MKTNFHLRRKFGNLSQTYKPFILIDRYQIKKLKEWGFKTFHPFIDESYDDVLDKDKRQR